jgi:hypothetical protein
MHALIIENEPIFDALTDEFPDVAAAMTRPRWSYDAALKAADEAIAKSKRPAKKAAKRAPRKAV